MKTVILNLGCGTQNRSPTDICLDISLSVKPDICADMQHLPFKDESFNAIKAIHCLEHVPDIVRTMNECWRVLKDDGLLACGVPCFPCESAVQDPTHVRFFVPETFQYFCTKGKLPGLNHVFERTMLNIIAEDIICDMRKRKE